MNIIKKARKAKGLTRREVAKYLDLPLLVYVYYEVFGIEKLHADIYLDMVQYFDDKS